MKKLSIDTTSIKEVTVTLTIDSQKHSETRPLDYHKAQIVLPMIEEMLEKHQVPLSDVSGIEVNPGPGSFTGVRVGVAVANALGFALGIPVNGKKAIVEPIY